MSTGVSFTVRVSGFRNSRGQFASLANSLPNGSVEVMHKIGPELQNKFIQKTPVGPSGNLAGGWAFFVEYTPDGAALNFENNVGYLDAVLKGRSPGLMHARNAKYMHFFWQGGEHFRKTVYHPGTKPNDFLQGIDNEYFRIVEPEMSFMALLQARRYMVP